MVQAKSDDTLSEHCDLMQKQAKQSDDTTIYGL